MAKFWLLTIVVILIKKENNLFKAKHLFFDCFPFQTMFLKLDKFYFFDFTPNTIPTSFLFNLVVGGY